MIVHQSIGIRNIALNAAESQHFLHLRLAVYFLVGISKKKKRKLFSKRRIMNNLKS
jgi:hypothetical protein